MFTVCITEFSQTLQQAISDHEPEFVSLQRELSTLCQGPTTETAFYDHLSQELQDSSGRNEPRPGQQIQEDTLRDYQTRLDALKRKLMSHCDTLSVRLEQCSQLKSDVAELKDWVDDILGHIDELVIGDPKSEALEEQHSKCKVWHSLVALVY